MKKEYKLSTVQILFCIVIFIVVTANISKLNQICVIDDEFGYWGTGAYFAGYDWTGLTPTSPYYGFGIGLIYSLFFRLFTDPVVIYKAAIILNAFFLIGAFLCSINCFERLYPNVDKLYGLLFCSLITFYPNNIVQSQVGWTESLLYFWFWLCFWLILVIWEKSSCIKCSLLGFLLMYGYMVHQRTLGVLLSGIIVMIIGTLINRVSKKGFLSFIIALIIGLWMFINIKEYLNNNFWLTMEQEISDLNNMSGQMMKIQQIFSFDGIKEFFFGFFSKAFYLIISSCGLILLGISVLLKEILEIGRRIIVNKKLDHSVFGISAIYLMLSFVSTFAISAIFMININFRLDVLMYGRYNEFVIGPILMLGCMTVKNKANTKKSIIFIILLIASACIISNIVDSFDFTAFYSMNATGISRFFESMNQPEDNVFIAVIGLVVIILIVIIGNYKIKDSFKYSFLVCALLVLFWWKPSIDYNCNAIYKTQEMYSKYTKDIAEYIESKDTDRNIVYLIDDENQDTFYEDMYDRNIKYIQFYMYDKKIECEKISEYREESEKKIYIIRKESGVFQSFCKKGKYLYGNDMYSLFLA